MKRVLFVTSADLMKVYNNGGEHACKTNLKFLCDLYGEDNINVCFFSEYKGKLPDRYFSFPRLRKWKAALAQMLGYKMYFPWEEKKILKLIHDISPDIIFFDGAMVGTLLPKISSNIYKIVFEQNCEKKFYRLKMKHEGIIYAIEYFAIVKNEKLAINNCDCLICISERDKDDIYQEYGKMADIVLPVSFENKFCFNLIENKTYDNELLFVGSNFGPNYDGIKWFIDNVMIELPNYKLYIVGKDFEKNKAELERDNVIVIGSVESVEEYYYRYPVLVMPILYGSGMKVKTAEAMMYGKTILATDEALEGYEVDGIKGIYRCNSKQEFISSIKLHCNKDIPVFREEVHHLYQAHYSNQAVYKILKEILPSGGGEL